MHIGTLLHGYNTFGECWIVFCPQYQTPFLSTQKSSTASCKSLILIPTNSHKPVNNVSTLSRFSLLRRKLQNRLKESEEALAATEAKYSALDKTKNRLAAELDDLNLDLEKVGWAGLRDSPVTSTWTSDVQLCRNSLTISTYIWLYSYPLFLSLFSSLTPFPLASFPPSFLLLLSPSFLFSSLSSLLPFLPPLLPSSSSLITGAQQCC